MKFIGSKLRELRESKGLALQDVKEIYGISLSTMSDIENGINNPRKATVEKLCEVFGVDEIYFYVDDKETLEKNFPELDKEVLDIASKKDKKPYILLTDIMYESGMSAEEWETVLKLIAKNKKE